MPTHRHTKITVNGRHYTSAQDMPPADRKIYEDTLAKFTLDRNQNGIPDLFESAQSADTTVSHVVTTHSELFDINGQHYSRFEDMPPDLRDMVKSTLAHSDHRDPSDHFLPRTKALDGHLTLHLSKSTLFFTLTALSLLLLLALAYRAGWLY